MKFGSGKEGAQISYVGTDDHIEEFVIFANKSDNGFAVVRVLVVLFYLKVVNFYQQSL